MEKRIEVSFPGNKRVDAALGEFTVSTDQLPRNGGDGTAPQPFDLFFVSLATCAGISALEYCQERSMPTEGLGVTLVATRHPSEPRYDRVRIEVTVPDSFPDEHLRRLVEEVEGCSVKRHILEPPAFEVLPIMGSQNKSADATR
jgi:ribosomal protein S12 methylthiotransferase accessory factor